MITINLVAMTTIRWRDKSGIRSEYTVKELKVIWFGLLFMVTNAAECMCARMMQQHQVCHLRLESIY